MCRAVMGNQNGAALEPLATSKLSASLGTDQVGDACLMPAFWWWGPNTPDNLPEVNLQPS